MKRSNRLVILVGVLLAVLAFVAIVILLNQRGPSEVAPEEVLEPVLVATEDIDIGEEVTPDKVEVQEVPAEAVQGTSLIVESAVSGEPALFAVPEGAQVPAGVIGRDEDTIVDLPTLLQPGEKAIAFQVDRVTGLDFLVKAGDTIDVVLSEQISVLQETADSAANADENAPPRFEAVTGLQDQRTVKAILQDKRVLYVSDTRAVAPEDTVDTDGDGVPDAPADETTPLDTVIIVFAGTTQDAEVIKFAQNDLTEQGSLTAIVRNADDDEVVETIGITIDQLVSEYGLRIPSIVEQLNEEAAP